MLRHSQWPDNNQVIFRSEAGPDSEIETENKVNAGVVEALVKLVEAGSGEVKGQDSATFKAEVVQHLLTLQVSHPQLREAIQEVCLPAVFSWYNSCSFSQQTALTSNCPYSKALLQSECSGRSLICAVLTRMPVY